VVTVTATRAIGVAVVALVAYLAWGWLVTSEEDRVRAAVSALAETLSSDATDPLGQVTALGRLRTQLTADVVVTAGGGAEIRGRDAVAGLWQRVRASGDAARVRIVDLEVVVAEDGVTATADGVAELTLTRGGVPERELREARATFVAEDGEWRLSAATLVDVVTPP
jgi:ketosteroid isomerase-like protein